MDTNAKILGNNPSKISKCSTDNCNKNVRARGMCPACWKRWRKNAKPSDVRRVNKSCSVVGCNNKYHKNDFCYNHWLSIWKKDPKNKEKISKWQRKADKKRRSVIKKGRLIKAEVLKTPTKEIKMVWDGMGYWSKQYDQCVECNSTLYIYAGNGLCKYCYNRLAYHDYDFDGRRSQKSRCKQRKARKELICEYKEMYKKAKEGSIEITPKISNILSS